MSDSWRDFRAALAAGDRADAVSSWENVARLKRQDEALWREYMDGGDWAHETGFSEPGGLLCAQPVQGQLLRQLRHGSSEYSAEECLLSETPESHWACDLRARLLEADSGGVSSREEVEPEEMERWLDLRESSPAALAHAWRVATQMCNEALGRMRTGMKRPTLAEAALWKRQCAALDIRGQVCLVLDEQGTCLQLNRLHASTVDMALARRLLVDTEQTDFDSEAIDDAASRFVDAFGDCVVYHGGPEAADEGGRVVHGHDGIGGSVELSSGSRIYVAESRGGGLEAIVDAVLDGRAHATDFRLFLGCHTGLGGTRTERPCEWLPVACSRPLLLKHTTGLPKPYWHEVMERCGGECAELSRLVRAEGEGSAGRRRASNSAEDTPGR